MLIEFRVKNFKSIRNEQVLSLVANKDPSFEDTHVIKTGVYPSYVLKSAVIYGLNAGGKTNLLQALIFMRKRIITGYYSGREYDNKNDLISPPFKLDIVSRNEPSEFEITFISDKIRYQYGFSLSQTRIMEEWLLVYKSSKPQEWFRRTVDKEKDEDIYKFSSYFKGQKDLWRKSTRKEALFLTVAVDLNCEQLRPAFKWIHEINIFTDKRLNRRIISPKFDIDRDKENYLNFLLAADLGIMDIDVKTEKEKRKIFSADNMTDQTREFIELENKRPVFIHPHDGFNEVFEFDEESGGAQKLFKLSFDILNLLKHGGILIVDELETNLHPMLLRFVIALFNSIENKKGAQLIFTTHNTSILDTKELFRRDQIWFVEKDNSQATVLYPLSDFCPRKEADVESGYLTGRYGAVPYISGFVLKSGE
jgi:AAA15 family ATPase/GTPase